MPFHSKAVTKIAHFNICNYQLFVDKFLPILTRQLHELRKYEYRIGYNRMNEMKTN